MDAFDTISDLNQAQESEDFIEAATQLRAMSPGLFEDKRGEAYDDFGRLRESMDGGSLYDDLTQENLGALSSSAVSGDPYWFGSGKVSERFESWRASSAVQGNDSLFGSGGGGSAEIDSWRASCHSRSFVDGPKGLEVIPGDCDPVRFVSHDRESMTAIVDSWANDGGEASTSSERSAHSVSKGRRLLYSSGGGSASGLRGLYDVEAHEPSDPSIAERERYEKNDAQSYGWVDDLIRSMEDEEGGSNGTASVKSEDEDEG